MNESGASPQHSQRRSPCAPVLAGWNEDSFHAKTAKKIAKDAKRIPLLIKQFPSLRFYILRTLRGIVFL
jgi:hypothetical protein